MRRFAVAAVLVLSLAACSGQSKDVSPAPTSVSTTPVAPLSAARAIKAALMVSDLPKGWDGGVAADPSPAPGSRGQYDPPECLAFRHPTDKLGKPATAVRGQYFTREPLQSVTEFVWSWPTRPDSVVPDLTGEFAKCTSYTMAINNETYRWTAKRLPVRAVADGMALRFDTSTADDASFSSAVYVAYVVRDGTVLDIEASGELITDAVFTQVVSKAVTRLDAAAR